MTTNYIFVTGGVVSSLGKGIAAASLAAILEARGLNVTMMKLDPYINVDPGTMSPIQHGEVFVTEDGAETDLDLGHYERFIRKIDPKHQNFEKFGKVWNLFVVLFTVMMAAFSWLSDLAVFGKLPDSSNLVSILVCGGIGVLFIILGNFMPQIKQNYTFGCRTPWALNDEHNWQRTQRMGGYTFVVMGIVLLVLAFLGGLLGDIATLIVLLAAVLGGSAWIYLYSYLVYVGKMK